MEWYRILSLSAFLICLASCLYHAIRLIRKGSPEDLSTAAAAVGPGVAYSFTGGMSPKKKESAYLHLPTYTAGLFYHGGTFLCILLFFVLWAGISIPETLSWMLSAILMISSLAGLGILVKRMIKPELKALSNPDDYISNLLVTAFQVCTLLYLHNPGAFYFVATALLWLYLPLGKLKHTIYFFAARYQLGFFFGRRGVWPPQN